MAEGGGLENRCTREGTVGSNPTSSATSRALAHSPPVLRDISVTMLNTGMRPAEVYAIRKEDVHPEFIFIPRGKTRFARRSIPLTEQAREVLFGRKRHAKNGWLFPHRTDPDRHMTICRSFLDVRRSLGLDFRLYDLRHTFGSRAVMAGVDLPTLKELMGHSPLIVTSTPVHRAHLNLGWLVPDLSTEEQP